MIVKNKLPKHVSLNGVALRLQNKDHEESKEYYRHAGMWAVDYEFREGKLFSVNKGPLTT